MKDTVDQIYDELNAQVVRVLEHSLNQASRIAELETKLQEQDAMLGRRPCLNSRCMDMVSAQSRIAELERQLQAKSVTQPYDQIADARRAMAAMFEAGKPVAKASAPAVEQQREPAGWREAMQEFVDRVERGEIRSKYTHEKFKALLATPSSQDKAQEELSRVYDMFHIGAQAREIGVLMENIRNTIRLADMLSAVEREFFMIRGEPDEDYPDEEPQDECLVNSWGSTIEQYVEQFRTALVLKAKEACAKERSSWDLTCSEQAMEIEYLKEQQAAPQAADTDKVREAIANISNNQITEAWESCGGVGGFYKSFGYQQFAHAVLDLAADALSSMAAQAPVREVPGWQPIDTAPKDMASRLYLLGRYCVQGFTDAAGELMVQSEISPHWRKMRGKPTHWMPLPSPPEADK